MKLFISWSGDLAKEIAEIFRQWIPGVIQAAKPYYTPDDITKGTRWNTEISKELDASKIGIICLTKENLDSPWIMFEAGALSKNLEKSKVCPLLFGIDTSDIKGPLVQFQAAKFSKKEVKKVIKMMNDQLEETKLENDVLDNVFDMWWPKLEDQVNKAMEKARNETDNDLRSDRDLLEEVLSLTREMTISRRRRPTEFIHPGAIEDILNTLEQLVSIIDFENIEMTETLERLYRPLEHIIEEGRNHFGVSSADEMYSRLRRFRLMVEEKSHLNENKRIFLRRQKDKE